MAVNFNYFIRSSVNSNFLLPPLAFILIKRMRDERWKLRWCIKVQWTTNRSNAHVNAERKPQSENYIIFHSLWILHLINFAVIFIKMQILIIQLSNVNPSWDFFLFILMKIFHKKWTLNFSCLPLSVTLSLSPLSKTIPVLHKVNWNILSSVPTFTVLVTQLSSLNEVRPQETCENLKSSQLRKKKLLQFKFV